MISEATARSEMKYAKRDLRKALVNKNYEDALRDSLYIDFLNFVLNWREDE